MSSESRLKTLLTAWTIIVSITTIVFAALSIMNVNSWFLRLGTQISLFLLNLSNGISFLYRKQKNTGYFLIGVAALMFFVVVSTIMAGIKRGAL